MPLGTSFPGFIFFVREHLYLLASETQAEMTFSCYLFVVALRSEEDEEQNAYQHQDRIVKVRDQSHR